MTDLKDADSGEEVQAGRGGMAPTARAQGKGQWDHEAATRPNAPWTTPNGSLWLIN
jgi:hypothetical protein